MAAERKLKGEIDKTLKKVSEGQELFEDLWNQVIICEHSIEVDTTYEPRPEDLVSQHPLRDCLRSEAMYYVHYNVLKAVSIRSTIRSMAINGRSSRASSRRRSRSYKG